MVEYLFVIIPDDLYIEMIYTSWWPEAIIIEIWEEDALADIL